MSGRSVGVGSVESAVSSGGGGGGGFFFGFSGAADIFVFITGYTAAMAYAVPALDTLVLGDILTPRRQALLAAGSTGSWLRQIALVRASFEPTIRVLPGHGPETTLAPAADWQQAYLQHYRQDVGAALKAAAAHGHCIGPTQARAIEADMAQAFPVDEQVAQIPPEVLAGLNLDGVAWELKGRVCKPVDNPMRGK